MMRIQPHLDVSTRGAGERRECLVRELLAVALVPLLLAAGTLQAQVQVGHYYPADFATPRDYAGAVQPKTTEVRWRHVIHHPGATYIAVHFTDFDLSPGDRLMVCDAEGGQQYAMAGRGKMDAGTFWARHVKGETAVLELQVSGAAGGGGFRIDQYAAGFVDLTTFSAAKSICGDDDRRNAVCYRDTLPEVYDTCRAVCRLLSKGSALCTGSLVSEDNLVLTNNHCIPDPGEAVNIDFDFMAEAPDCEDENCLNCWSGDVYSGSVMVNTNTGYDYALVRLAEGDPASLYGYLEIDDRVPVIGEQIYSANHAGGWAKMIAYHSTDPADTGGVGRIASIDEPTCLASAGIDEVGYYLDGYGGASGSPIIAASTDRLIALHHCGGCPNRGVAAHLFYPEIERFVTGRVAIGGIAPGALVVTSDSASPGYEPEKAIDHDAATGWRSASSGGAHWLQIDLGQVAAVTGFRVWHASTGGLSPSLNTRAFEIQSAPTASGPWTTRFVGDNAAQHESSTFNCERPQAMRHVRLKITDPGQDGAARVQVFEVFAAPAMFEAIPSGTNVAPFSPYVHASSTYAADPKLGGDKAVDGVISLDSRWVSAGTSPPHFLTLDLGRVRDVTGFILRQAGYVESSGYNADALSFWSARSLNGPWYEEALLIVTDSSDDAARCFISPKQMRYVRLSIADPGPKHDPYARVPEFEVIEAPAGLHAGFAAFPYSGPGPLTVDFTDVSSGGSLSSWYWNFGDGAVSTEQHPTHAYHAPGRYTVSLVINGGEDTVTRAECIEVTGPRADFTTTPTTGYVPLTVSFTDWSNGTITDWLWDFGDGSHSTAQHPEHVYQTPGLYSVSLTIDGPAGTDTMTRAKLIEVRFVLPDFDRDGDVDQSDFGHLQNCFTGPGQAPGPGCADTDLDGDGDADATDGAVLIRCLSGAGVPADPVCDD